MSERPDASIDNAEALVSRLGSDRVVTDSSDRSTTGAPWMQAKGAPVEPAYYAGDSS